MSAKVLQEFLLSSIFYLFYTAELLKICNSFQDRLNASAFVNDITFLIYRFFIEWNCCILEYIHDWCLKWVCRYEVIFVSDKYDFIHLSNKFNKFNMQTFIQLDAVIKNSETKIRILEVWINSQLKWDAHVKKILSKMKTQINVLHRTTVSIWKVMFTRICHIYSAVVRSVLVYEAAVWHVFI